ncbi:ZIP family metal transporter [Massilia sp. HP4]|uniref:ZIP family metal transporter n=1 Tax=Massilia sp. HP4 TaxID=2562316 RepID=UPI001E40342E|nr:ZIP family metal transporter [Massilia sp. HP4]
MVSISAAALVWFNLLQKMAERLPSLSVGIMLSASLLHALPEAFEADAAPDSLFATLLVGVLVFFLLEKFATLHAASGVQDRPGATGHSAWMVLAGDGLHNFTDGIMIAAAFLADPGLGVLTALAIVAHEIPQEVGDFIVLLDAGYSRGQAYLSNLLSSLMGLAGGTFGYLALERAGGMVPYVLSFASAGFLYVAVSDLMPRLQRETSLGGTLCQFLLIGAG